MVIQQSFVRAASVVGVTAQHIFESELAGIRQCCWAGCEQMKTASLPFSNCIVVRSEPAAACTSLAKWLFPAVTPPDLLPDAVESIPLISLLQSLQAPAATDAGRFRACVIAMCRRNTGCGGFGSCDQKLPHVAGHSCGSGLPPQHSSGVGAGLQAAPG